MMEVSGVCRERPRRDGTEVGGVGAAVFQGSGVCCTLGSFQIWASGKVLGDSWETLSIRHLFGED